MLTRKQRELLSFLDTRLNKTGVCPSFDEMREALGLKSKSGIHRLIGGLEERGFVRRLPHRARALEILRLPEDMAAKAADGAAADGALSPALPEKTAGQEDPRRPGAGLNVIQGNFRGLDGHRKTAAETEVVSLPLYGRIAAGTPIEALENQSERIAIPAEMVTRGEHYALEVVGDSMIEDGIFDGDVAIVERCDTAENGTIVVALVDGEEVTLKHLRRRGASIALEPANPAYETRIFGPDRIRVQGRLVGLIRRY